MLNGNKGRWHLSPTVELIIFAVLAEAVFLLSRALGLFEALTRWFARHNTWETGDVLVVAVFLSVAVAVFGLRRWREANQLLHARDQRIDELLLAMTRSEVASKDRGELFVSMSDQMRAPMSGIIGVTQLASESSPSQMQQQYLDVIKESANSLLETVTELLEFAKLDAGKIELKATNFGMRELVREILESLVPAADQKGLALNYRVASEVPDELVGDSFRLRQIIVNLVENALQFTERGSVAIHVECDRGDSNGVLLSIGVRDTGVGIPQDLQESMFETFAHVKGRSSGCKHRIGLGLAMTSRLVELMGGRIFVDSSIGKGSTFHFSVRLPVQNQKVARTNSSQLATASSLAIEPHGLGSAEPQSVKQPDGNSAAPGNHPLDEIEEVAHILVAEDNLVSQCILVGLLRKRGYTVATVADGREALQARGTRPFQIVLMDVEMPGMDGLKATAAIRESERRSGRHVPIVAMTAGVEIADRERCLQAGMDAYLTKPVIASDLFATLERLIPPSNRIALTEAQDQATSIERSKDEDSSDDIAAESNSVHKLFAAAKGPLPIDVHLLRTRIQNDLVLLLDMINTFQKSSPELLACIERAAGHGDCGEIAVVAHAFKGALWNMCAGPCARAVLDLELAARQNDRTRVQNLAKSFKHEYQRLQAALAIVAKFVREHEKLSKSDAEAAVCAT